MVGVGRSSEPRFGQRVIGRPWKTKEKCEHGRCFGHCKHGWRFGLECGKYLCRQHGVNRTACVQCGPETCNKNNYKKMQSKCEHDSPVGLCVIGWRDNLPCGHRLCRDHGKQKNRCVICSAQQLLKLNRVTPVSVRHCATQTDFEQDTEESACGGSKRTRVHPFLRARPVGAKLISRAMEVR